MNRTQNQTLKTFGQASAALSQHPSISHCPLSFVSLCKMFKPPPLDGTPHVAALPCICNIIFIDNRHTRSTSSARLPWVLTVCFALRQLLKQICPRIREYPGGPTLPMLDRKCVPLLAMHLLGFPKQAKPVKWNIGLEKIWWSKVGKMHFSR